MSWYGPSDDAVDEADVNEALEDNPMASSVVASPPAPTTLGAGAQAYPLAPYAPSAAPMAPAAGSFRGAMKDEAGRRLVGALFGVVGTVVPGLLVVGALYVGYRLVRARVEAARAAREAPPGARGRGGRLLEEGRGVGDVGGTRSAREKTKARTRKTSAEKGRGS